MFGWERKRWRWVNLNAAPRRRTSDASWPLAWGRCPLEPILITCYISVLNGYGVLVQLKIVEE